MIKFELEDLQVACVLRALRYKREIILADRERLLHGPGADDRLTSQTVEVLNAELMLLDSALDGIWQRYAVKTLETIQARHRKEDAAKEDAAGG